MATDLSTLSQESAQELHELGVKVKCVATALHLWNHRLTPAEQARLGGDFAKAYESFDVTTARAGSRVIEMWCRLRGDCSEDRAVVDIAESVGYLTSSSAAYFRRVLGEGPLDVRDHVAIPKWNKDRCELWFKGRVVRRIISSTIATRSVLMLDAFEEDGWPPRIDDPLSKGPNPGRLRSAIAQLNRGLSGIVFAADGTGKGIRWRAL